MWIGGKFWELARDPGDPWNSRYLEGMSACTLRWSKYRKEWLEAIKSCDSEESENAWRRVIHSGGCSGTRNYKALYDLLIQILDLGDDCAKSIRSAAFNRLNEIIYQVESQEFDEASLGLPLSRRH